MTCITLLEELPGLRPFIAEEFSGYDAAQLNGMAEQLQQQLRARNSSYLDGKTDDMG